MDTQEAVARLEVISEMIDQSFRKKQSMLLSTAHLLERIQSIALGIENDVDDTTVEAKPTPVKPIKHIIMSCDASIKKNPGGPASVGVVIELPKSVEPDADMRRLEIAQRAPSTSSNQAEYDAIYFGLTSLMNLRNNPGCEIEVRSDSQLAVRQLNGEVKCNDEELKRRRDVIREYVQSLPVPVKFVWRPRNSTPELELANYLAQDLLSVPRH